MKNFEMFNFTREFSRFDGLEGFDFILRLNKNKRLFEQEIKDMQDTREGNSKFKEYKTKTQELLVKYSDKKDDGSPIINPVPNQPGQGNYSLTTQRPIFNTEHAKLIVEYKTAINAQDKLDQVFNESMDKDILVEPYYIKEDEIPRNIKSEQMNLLYPVVTFKPEKGRTKKTPLKKIK